MNHHRRGATYVDQIHAQLCQLGCFLFVVLKDVVKFLLGSRPDPHGERDHADSFGKQTDKFLQRTGTMGRFHVADDASPTLEHSLSPLFCSSA